jgi:N-dimethylarginine dimethylaminohydrolase
MVGPDYFSVDYAINPYMQDQSGELNKVNISQAKIEWQNLKNTYEKLGFEVSVIPAVKNLPDMVFAANQSFVYWRREDKNPSVILSSMRSSHRAPEVEYFEEWYRLQDYNVHRLETVGAFEGTGDALYHPAREVLFGGYGPRTDKEVYEEINMRSGLRVVPLELKSAHFYHLDTCFTILNKDTVALVKEAFTSEGLKSIEKEFLHIIEINKAEALNYFAGNAHAVKEEYVILHPEAHDFETKLKDRGFKIINAPTYEFMKSGGSVFCLKMQCW